MKSLQQHIIEKLIVNKNYKHTNIDWEELNTVYYIVFEADPYSNILRIQKIEKPTIKKINDKEYSFADVNRIPPEYEISDCDALLYRYNELYMARYLKLLIAPYGDGHVILKSLFEYLIKNYGKTDKYGNSGFWLKDDLIKNGFDIKLPNDIISSINGMYTLKDMNKKQLTEMLKELG